MSVVPVAEGVIFVNLAYWSHNNCMFLHVLIMCKNVLKIRNNMHFCSFFGLFIACYLVLLFMTYLGKRMKCYENILQHVPI